MGRPQMTCRTLGSSDFMRVPSPAAQMIACRVLMIYRLAALRNTDACTRCSLAPLKAGEPGLEPGRRGPKPLVLPLHYSPIRACTKVPGHQTTCETYASVSFGRLPH